MRCKCENCGGQVNFSPENKGNVCSSCGSVFPIKYNYQFNKKPFSAVMGEEGVELASAVKSAKCLSCGANVIFPKFQVESVCQYCGSPAVSVSSKKKLMAIDSVIPFSFGKEEALKKFKLAVSKRFYANKRIFKNVTEKDVKGVYVNAFVFDMSVSSNYHGTFTYSKEYTNSKGERKFRTEYKTVSGVFEKNYDNLAVEANSNLTQEELKSILPFNYAQAVDFEDDFISGYMLEYKDKMFNECVAVAENIIKTDIETSLLRQYKCDHIQELTLRTEYPIRTYNFCLLPVYFISTTNKGKQYKAVMNGQNGNVGKLPTSAGKVLLTVFFALAFIIAIVFGIMFFCQ